MYPDDPGEDQYGRAPFCDKSMKGMPLFGFDAAVSFGSHNKLIKFPEGYGLSIGASSGLSHVVMILHIVDRAGRDFTENMGAKVRIVPTDENETNLGLKRTNLLVLSVRGWLPANSVGVVRAEYNFTFPVIGFIDMDGHGHGMLKQMKVSLKSGARRKVLLDVLDGIKTTARYNESLNEGDTIVIECTFRNNTPRRIRVWYVLLLALIYKLIC